MLLVASMGWDEVDSSLFHLKADIFQILQARYWPNKWLSIHLRRKDFISLVTYVEDSRQSLTGLSLLAEVPSSKTCWDINRRPLLNVMVNKKLSFDITRRGSTFCTYFLIIFEKVSSLWKHLNVFYKNRLF
jgi:hypothetical protein